MPPSAFYSAAFVIAGILAGALSVYLWLVARICRDGGKVRTEDFQLPDLLVALVLVGFFAGLVVRAALRHSTGEAPITAEQVIPGSLLFLVLLVGVAGFLKYRGLRLSRIFGMDQLSPVRAAGWASLLIAAVFPLVGAVNALTLLVLDKGAPQQPLVQLFREVVSQSDYATILRIFIAGVVIAPPCEEFLFRGFFYGVGKRYFGALFSALCTAVLFGAFHMNLASLPGLTVLAVCFTIAYERTGSLLVPIGMHALFNFTSLAYLYFSVRGALPA